MAPPGGSAERRKDVWGGHVVQRLASRDVVRIDRFRKMEGHREGSLAREYTPRVRLDRLVADRGDLLGGGAIVDRDRLDHEARKRRHHRGEQAGSKGKYLKPARRGAFREQS